MTHSENVFFSRAQPESLKRNRHVDKMAEVNFGYRALRVKVTFPC